jgi:putative addiction module component (TIGR02574 family)
MTPTPPETELTPDLINRVMKLSPENKDKLLDLLVNELDGPADDRTDEEVAAEIRRRSDEYHAGAVKPLTREESDASIRDEVRKLGLDLP